MIHSARRLFISTDLPLGSTLVPARKQRFYERFSCEYRPQEAVQLEVRCDAGPADEPELRSYSFLASKVNSYFRLFLWPLEEELASGAVAVVRGRVRCLEGERLVQMGPALLEPGAGWEWHRHRPKQYLLGRDWRPLTFRLSAGQKGASVAGMIHFSGDAQLQLTELSIEVVQASDSGLTLESAEIHRENGQLVLSGVFLSPPDRGYAGTPVDLFAGDVVVQRGILEANSAGELLLSMRAVCSLSTAHEPLSLRAAAIGQIWPVACRWDVEHGEALRAERAPPEALAMAGQVEGSSCSLGYTSSGASVVEGWVRDPEEPGQAVTVDLRIDGQMMGTGYASVLRQDVLQESGGSPLCGYRVELPQNFACGKQVKAEIVPRSDSAERPQFASLFQIPPVGHRLDKEPGAISLCFHPSGGESRQTYAAIVLTQNGADVLCDLLASIVAHEPNTFRQIIVVDHGSTDDTQKVLGRFARRLPLRIFARPATSSFSESNNFGASQCTEDVLVFVNNDIEFIAPVITKLGAHITPQVGMIGLKLLDPLAPGAPRGKRAPQHVGVHLSHHGLGSVRPLESRMLTAAPDANHKTVEVPLVTAALSVMERQLFEQLGGFDERYFYGWEDSDLCLRATEIGRKNLSVNEASCVHVRGYSRRAMPKYLATRRAGNREIFDKEWSYTLLRCLRHGSNDNLSFWTGRRVHVGFVVSEIGPKATAGDTMTALEFGLALSEKRACEVFFYDKHERVDAQLIDLLIILTDDFDVRTVANLGAATTVVAWARNWFPRWAARPWRERFDAWFASSERAAEYLAAELGRQVAVLRLATNPARFHRKVSPDEFLRAEVTFTGSHWGVARDIVQCARGLECDFRIFGEGWEQVPKMAEYASAPLPYERMPEVYRSTELVLDDSNFATATWGSLNSRVFDALACGTLVVTNNEVGSKELFGGLLPTYQDAESLRDLVDRYLGDDAQRSALVKTLRDKVIESETYEQRVEQLFGTLEQRGQQGLRIAIKLSVPSADKSDSWGDWHFATSLRRELEVLGHTVRLDCLDDWKSERVARDDACIVLRGLERYSPQASQLNLLWVISHPDKVSREELNQYDGVYVASRSVAERFREDCRVPVNFLPQCTDVRRFYPPEAGAKRAGAVFVANSRLVMRPVARAALDYDQEIVVYGTRWEGLLPNSMVRAQTVSNERVGQLYREAAVVLNDHWDDMRQRGFVSNRLFDAIACEALVLSDEVEGMQELFGGAVETFTNGAHFAEQLQKLLHSPELSERRKSAADHVREHHSFAKRAEVLDAALRTLDQQGNRLGAWGGGRRALPHSRVDLRGGERGARSSGNGPLSTLRTTHELKAAVAES